MTEQVEINEDRNGRMTTTAGQFLFMAMVEQGIDFIQFGVPEGQGFPFSVDVSLTVNGREVSFLKTLDRWMEIYDSEVKKAAKTLVIEKLESILTEFENEPVV